MIEPMFVHTNVNRHIDRFQRRGRSAVRSAWRLITATHVLGADLDDPDVRLALQAAPKLRKLAGNR